jgi:hypothetical protein
MSSTLNLVKRNALSSSTRHLTVGFKHPTMKARLTVGVLLFSLSTLALYGQWLGSSPDIWRTLYILSPEDLNCYRERSTTRTLADSRQVNATIENSNQSSAMNTQHHITFSFKCTRFGVCSDWVTAALATQICNLTGKCTDRKWPGCQLLRLATAVGSLTV